MKDNSREHFISHLPLIFNTFKLTGLINNITIKQQLNNLVINDYDYTFMTCEQYIKKLLQDDCKINCKFGFNLLTINKKIREKTKTMRGNINVSKFKNRFNELKLSTFNNSYCKLEEDWEENYKTALKMLLEQSPSIYLYNCTVITDYYLSIAIELSSYAFYIIYMNTDDINKKIFTQNFVNSLKSTKINEDIIISIFNIFENMERRNINMYMIDYNLLGEKAYKIKAFAKSLYYFDKDLLMNNDPAIIEKIILLFYRLGSPESAFGVIKLAENHQYEGIDDYDNKYIWYINVYDYRKALDIIEEQLKHEYDNNKINKLNKYKSKCLYGLLNWEKILLEDECEKKNNNKINEIYENNKQKNFSGDKYVDKYCEVTDVVKKELFFSYINISLDKWDELKIHISKINKKIKDNI